MEDDDEYWNASETSARAFSFDDDLLSPQEMLAIGKSGGAVEGDAGGVLAGPGAVDPARLTLTSLLSPAAVSLLLLAQSGTVRAPARPHPPENSVASTVRCLVLGRSCSLHSHRTLRDKTHLLDSAVALGDGNAILTVVLYLMQSLQRKLAHRLLASRPLALAHYVAFLKAESRITDLADLLTMLGKCNEAAMCQYEHAVKCHAGSPAPLLDRLKRVLADNSAAPALHTTAANYIQLLEWQQCTREPQLPGRSVLQCVAYCCARHWADTAGKIMSPLTLCKQQQVSPQQYDWVALNVHATLGHWDIVESLFTRKSWLGKTSISSVVPLDLIIHRLHQLGASETILETYINSIPNSKQRLEVAEQYKVHSVVIQLLTGARDRSALASYKMSLQPHSQAYLLAESVLQDPSIKWKN